MRTGMIMIAKKMSFSSPDKIGGQVRLTSA